LIGFFLTANDIGLYSVAVGFSTFFWIIPNAIQTVTYPATSEYWAKNDHVAMQKMMDKSMKYTACVLFPIGLGAGFFAEDIVTIVFGGEFVNAALSLQILIVGTVILGIVKAIGGSIAGVGRPDIGLKIVGIAAIINIILNVLLIPYFGIIGAAIATAISLSLVGFLGLLLTIKIVKVKIDFKWFAKIIGITFLAILVFMYVEFVNKYLLGMTILFIYVLILIMLLLTKEDRIYFKELLCDTHFFLKSFV